jgi:tRNA(fMet)-specific endonuclease VapC
MILLDTDTLSVAQHPDSPEALTLQSHLIMLPKDVIVGSTIISYEEQTRGWFGFLAKSKTRPEQVKAYFKVFQHLKDWRKANVFPFDEAAAVVLEQLRARKLRIGTFDLKIAAIALSLDATHLTRNSRHFGQITDLRIEDWTKP